MKIENLGGSSVLDRTASPSVEMLESRLLAAGEQSKRPDPEFEHLYQLLLAMEGQGEKAIHEFLRTLRGEDGATAAYPTAMALKTITQQVLVRLKEEGLEKSQLYKEVRGANGLAFAMEVYVQGVMRDVFQPMGDEAWEKSEW
ncbi:hypothetical protein SAMN03159488_00234 [Pseudomonas sp. NFIX10]|uniref:hypothetical protein n=1 Tax=unclassified Pseudomonas TaxID=196821 RepID=UPI0008E1856D|nr:MULTISPECIES: hypothetical protein [unclassified Pseudomonas]SFA73141.1 hypothetical protein SAMN03159488_00234 [Pseudomonas sp. NFIX10]SFE03794.1 hypothetical protein SAMN03159367_00128 [Pseudomonas sp. NFACC06-1]